MSDILENFAKIAKEKGWIKEAEESKESKSRYSKEFIESVGLLYGIKPKDEKSLAEQAHPESVILMETYDPSLGLVENLYEQQAMMYHIVNKPPRGISTNYKYVKAYNELVNALIKSAFLLDKKNETELMKKADDCADKLTKYAWTWRDLMPAAGFLTLPASLGLLAGAFVSGPVGITAAVAVAAIEAYSQWGQHYSADIQKSIDSCFEELQDILEDKEYQDLKQDVQKMMEDIRTFKDILNDANQHIGEMRHSNDPENSAELAKKSLSAVIKTINLMETKIGDWVKILSGSEQGESGLLSLIYRQVWETDVQDAIKGLQNLSSLLTTAKSAIEAKYQASKDYVMHSKTDFNQLPEEKDQTPLKPQKPASKETNHPKDEVIKFDTSHEDELNRLMNQFQKA